jgi:hypothetical protein
VGRWLFVLGGLLLWAVHFLGVYLIASLADLSGRPDDRAWRAAGLAFSGLCIVATATVLTIAVRRLRRPHAQGDRTLRFLDQLAALGAGAALVALVWQALPLVVGVDR